MPAVCLSHAGDIYGGGYCESGNECVPLLADEVAKLNGNSSTVIIAGVTILGNDSSYGAAIAAVSRSDVVILTVGTDVSVAGEGTDRTDIGLPGVQSQFALDVLAAAHTANVPVILLLIHNVSSFGCARACLRLWSSASVMLVRHAFVPKRVTAPKQSPSLHLPNPEQPYTCVYFESRVDRVVAL